MFTQPCFIRKNTPDLRKKLQEMGQRANTLDDFKGEWLAANYGMFISVQDGFQHLHPNDIDCGTNEELFLALAALQDDSDENQWFVYPNENNWFKCYDNNIEEVRNEPSIRMSCQSAWFYKSHKATVQELIEHFSKKEEKP